MNRALSERRCLGLVTGFSTWVITSVTPPPTSVVTSVVSDAALLHLEALWIGPACSLVRRETMGGSKVVLGFQQFCQRNGAYSRPS